jgi:hypothetical protein
VLLENLVARVLLEKQVQLDLKVFRELRQQWAVLVLLVLLVQTVLWVVQVPLVKLVNLLLSMQ